MARRKVQQVAFLFKKEADCDHAIVEYSSVGHSLFKTCQECFTVFDIGNCQDLAHVCMEKPDEDQGRFIDQVMSRFPRSNFRKVVEHEKVKKEYNIQQQLLRRLAE